MVDKSIPTRRTVSVHVPTLVIAIASGLVYAWFVWSAISDLIITRAEFQAFDVAEPWASMIAKILLPVIVWLIAYLVGRPRRSLDKIVLFIVGLATTAALGFGIQSVIRSILITALRGD